MKCELKRSHLPTLLTDSWLFLRNLSVSSLFESFHAWICFDSVTKFLNFYFFSSANRKGSSLTTDLRQIFSGMCGAGRIFCYWKIKIFTVPCLVQDLEKIFFKIETMEVCYQSNNSSLGLAKSIVSTFVYFQIWPRSFTDL